MDEISYDKLLAEDTFEPVFRLFKIQSEASPSKPKSSFLQLQPKYQRNRESKQFLLIYVGISLGSFDLNSQLKTPLSLPPKKEDPHAVTNTSITVRYFGSKETPQSNSKHSNTAYNGGGTG